MPIGNINILMSKKLLELKREITEITIGDVLSLASIKNLIIDTSLPIQ